MHCKILATNVYDAWWVTFICLFVHICLYLHFHTGMVFSECSLANCGECDPTGVCITCENGFFNNDGACQGTYINTLRPRQNGRHFADDIPKCIFLNENVWIPIEISMKFVSKGPINNIPALVQIMAWRRPGDKPLSKPMMVILTTHICVTRPQWVNTLWSRMIIWRHRSGPALAQVMAYCLTATSHYLIQCWLLISKVLWHSPESNFLASTEVISLYSGFENHTLKITATSLLPMIRVWFINCNTYCGTINFHWSIINAQLACIVSPTSVHFSIFFIGGL